MDTLNNEALKQFTRLEDPADSTTPILDSEEMRLGDLPRFAQIRALAKGEYPKLGLGQVWEDVSGTGGDQFGHRQVSITKILDDGTVCITHVNFDGRGSRDKLGETQVKIGAEFSTTINELGEEWVLVAVIVPLTNSGHARSGYKLPAPRRKPVAPKNATTSAKTVSELPLLTAPDKRATPVTAKWKESNRLLQGSGKNGTTPELRGANGPVTSRNINDGKKDLVQHYGR